MFPEQPRFPFATAEPRRDPDRTGSSLFDPAVSATQPLPVVPRPARPAESWRVESRPAPSDRDRTDLPPSVEPLSVEPLSVEPLSAPLPELGRKALSDPVPDRASWLHMLVGQVLDDLDERRLPVLDALRLVAQLAWRDGHAHGRR